MSQSVGPSAGEVNSQMTIEATYEQAAEFATAFARLYHLATNPDIYGYSIHFNPDSIELRVEVLSRAEKVMERLKRRF